MSIPIVKLGRRKRFAEMDLPEGIRKVAKEFGVFDNQTLFGDVLSTRTAAKAVLWEHRDHPRDNPIALDCADVEIATTSYFDELLKAWPRAVCRNATEDVKESFDLVAERRRRH